MARPTRSAQLRPIRPWTWVFGVVGAMVVGFSVGLLAIGNQLEFGHGSNLVPTNSLNTGTCFDDPSGTDFIDGVRLIDCSDPHGYEVFDTFEFGPPTFDESYPGESDAAEYTSNHCGNAARAVPTGELTIDEDLVVSALYPSRDTWLTKDDRHGICMVGALPDFALVGSILTGQATIIPSP